MARRAGSPAGARGARRARGEPGGRAGSPAGAHASSEPRGGPRETSIGAINIGSGLTRFTIPQLIAYAPIKAAVETFTRYLAKLVGARGITVNVVSPGALHTDFNREAFDQAPAMLDFISAQTTLGRVGQADDVGGVVSFLCSEDGRWITGQRLEVSGGMFL